MAAQQSRSLIPAWSKAINAEVVPALNLNAARDEVFAGLEGSIQKLHELTLSIDSLLDAQPKNGGRKSKDIGAQIFHMRAQKKLIITGLMQSDSPLFKAMDAVTRPAFNIKEPMQKAETTLALGNGWTPADVHIVADAIVKSKSMSSSILACLLALSFHSKNPEYTSDQIAKYVTSDDFDKKLKIANELMQPSVAPVITARSTPTDVGAAADTLTATFGELVVEAGGNAPQSTMQTMATNLPATAISHARPLFQLATSYAQKLLGMAIDSTAGMSMREIEARVPHLPVRDLGHILRETWATPRNSYPIVLVHGFGGFGKPFLNTLNYFGGLGDTAKYLTSLGYEVHVVGVGPFSSNWERAAEIYAQLSGTRVDYGEARSKKFGFSRYGRDYTGKGLVHGWGTDPKRKVNFIAHSMGGPTVNMLVSLLARGFDEEIEATEADSISPLFKKKDVGASAYVNAVLALNSPYQGATLDDILVGQPASSLAKTVIGVSEAFGQPYDAKLDHWGLAWEREKETYHEFIQRLAASDWAHSKSYAGFDLSTENQTDPLLSFPKIESDVFYFTSSGYSTFNNPITGTDIPSLSMNAVLSPLAILVGSTTMGKGKEWSQNDGIVNTVSMSHPIGAPYDPEWGNINLALDTESILLWDANKPKAPVRPPVRGIVQSIGPPMKGFDHVAVVGTLSISPYDAYVIAQNCAALLSSTPP